VSENPLLALGLMFAVILGYAALVYWIRIDRRRDR
jgi:hypothetical protein